MSRNTTALPSPFYPTKKSNLSPIYRSTSTKYFVSTLDFLQPTTLKLIGRPNDLIIL